MVGHTVIDLHFSMIIGISENIANLFIGQQPNCAMRNRICQHLNLCIICIWEHIIIIQNIHIDGIIQTKHPSNIIILSIDIIPNPWHKRDLV